MSDIKCPGKECNGIIEASTKIYLDVNDAVFNDEGVLIIEEVEFSHLNDEYKSIPCNVESEMSVSCTDCGNEVEWMIGASFKEALAPQPVGNAARQLGVRGTE